MVLGLTFCIDLTLKRKEEKKKDINDPKEQKSVSQKPRVFLVDTIHPPNKAMLKARTRDCPVVIFQQFLFCRRQQALPVPFPALVSHGRTIALDEVYMSDPLSDEVET